MSSARLWTGLTDLGTVPPTAARSAHGLRSASAPNGYYAGARSPRKPRQVVPRNGVVTSNRRDPKVAREIARLDAIDRAERDDAPVIRYGSSLVSSVRQGEW